ncbi:hypothetical protein [Nocardia cyriacigeorgica]|uniref:hypothetical protein n=1 Tax=Nocardia cyriacigeorgica TaxID=135487 RepID=UPI002458A606|nr:hypothetical protein [Nocardia cyriacigeorgica]
MRTTALRAIPIIGWLYLVAGLIAASTRRAPAHRLPRVLWWIDAFLSIVVHAAQIPFALRAARHSGRSTTEIALMTQIFGLTWWRTADHGQREDTR